MTDNVTKIWGVSLSILAFSLAVSTASAQTCGEQPTCKELGYTSNIVCPNALKCPFDMSKMYCPSDESCKVGSILYSDKTCSTELDQSKTPIAVVFDEKKRLAASLKTAFKEWGGYGNNVDGLTPCTNLNVSTCDTDGKVNTAIILAFGKKYNISFPAAEYCNTYITEGTEAGDWFLPSTAEYLKMQDIATTLQTVTGNTVAEVGWTSNENTNYYAFRVALSKTTSTQITSSKKETKYILRPVLAF